jgi:hypothetical protein
MITDKMLKGRRFKATLFRYPPPDKSTREHVDGKKIAWCRPEPVMITDKMLKGRAPTSGYMNP